MPSADELDLIYRNAKEQIFANHTYYWSSSEHNKYMAWFQNFDDGYKFSDYKDQYIMSVLAVLGF